MNFASWFYDNNIMRMLDALAIKPTVLWTDILVFVLLIVTGLAIRSIRRQPTLRAAWGDVLGQPFGRISLFVLCVFVCIGVLDSLHYRVRIPDVSSAANANGIQHHGMPKNAQYSTEVLSVLDAIVMPLKNHTEKTYSAPMATHLYAKETVELPAGGQQRIFPPLLYPKQHILGTDKVGQDVLYLTLKSIRTALIIGTLSTLMMLPFAVWLGITAGYFGGWIDDVIQYIYTTLNSIPGVLLIAAAVLMMQVVIESHPTWFATAAARADARLLSLCVILGLTSWTGLCRLLRAETLKLRELDFIHAAQCFGVGRLRIIMQHILPNLSHIILISVVMDFSGLVLAEAVLSYVGIGVDPNTISFGTMINAARMELSRDPIVWWPLGAAFIAMFVLVLAANLFADGVRDAFDPRRSRHVEASLT
jgi:ABC-type dipeptide/oligopeptide/nickel transport system permease subunit